MFNSLVHSFILSQLFGVYLLIIAILMLSRVNYFRKMISHLQPDNPVIILGAAIGLLLGLVLVDIHNIWVLAPRVVVTILCWSILIKSLLWLMMPAQMLMLAKKMYVGAGYYLIVFCMTVIAVVLIFRGFYLFEIHHVLPH